MEVTGDMAKGAEALAWEELEASMNSLRTSASGWNLPACSSHCGG